VVENTYAQDLVELFTHAWAACVVDAPKCRSARYDNKMLFDTFFFPLARACVSPARSLLHMDSGYNMYGLHGWSGSQQALHSTLWSYALDEDHDPRGGIQQWQMMRSSKFLRFT